MTHFYSTFATPAGIFSVAVDRAGAVVATAFGDVTALGRRFNAGELIADGVALRPAREQVQAYFVGEREDFTLELAPAGTPFQQRVWAALRAIPFGETRSYGALARALGSSARAVGRANATNPICLIVPCHRVIGADGALTGFAFGETIKAQLIAHERAFVASA